MTLNFFFFLHHTGRQMNSSWLLTYIFSVTLVTSQSQWRTGDGSTLMVDKGTKTKPCSTISISYLARQIWIIILTLRHRKHSRAKLNLCMFTENKNAIAPRSLKYTGELWSKFPFQADKVEKAADSNRDCGKYDIHIISRISNLH